MIFKVNNNIYNNKKLTKEIEKKLKKLNLLTIDDQSQKIDYELPIINYYHFLDKKHGFFGRIKFFCKRLLRKTNKFLIEPIVIDQENFNEIVLNELNAINNKLDLINQKLNNKNEK